MVDLFKSSIFNEDGERNKVDPPSTVAEDIAKHYLYFCTIDEEVAL